MSSRGRTAIVDTCSHFTRFAAVFPGALLLRAGRAAHADDIEVANNLFKQGQ
jgi:hypothetical protein